MSSKEQGDSKATMQDADVIVVGAGLTGLRAAQELAKAGLSVLVFEKGTAIGGRVTTHDVGGYKLDYGFQALLSASPEVKKIGGLAKLKCGSFSSGARVRVDGRFVELFDPFRHPDQFVSTLRSRLATVRDLLLFLRLIHGRTIPCATRSKTTTTGLTEMGFSTRFQESFLRPLLRAVLLDPVLNTDFGLACFYLQMLGKGDVVLPEGGMQALPSLLADQIGRSHIRMNSAVNSISQGEVTLENGDTFSARQVVCATDALAAAQMGSPEQTMHHLGASTLYFSTTTPPFTDRLLVISAEDGPIATLAVVSNIQHSYAPSGKSLIAISVIGNAAQLPEGDLLNAVLTQAVHWYGAAVKDWNYLTRRTIPTGIVSQPRMTDGWIERDGVLFAGDYLSYPSQDGALLAGRSVAELIIDRLV